MYGIYEERRDSAFGYDEVSHMDVSTVARPVKVSISSKQILLLGERRVIVLLNIDWFLLKDHLVIFRKIHPIIIHLTYSF